MMSNLSATKDPLFEKNIQRAEAPGPSSKPYNDYLPAIH